MGDTLLDVPQPALRAATPASAPIAARQGWLRLSPINRRRLNSFKANKRGWWSLWIFLTLFVLSLFAEFIANDRPLLVRYKGETLFPVVMNYPEEKFGASSPPPITATRSSPRRSRRMAGRSGRRSAIPTARIISTCRCRPLPRRPGC